MQVIFGLLASALNIYSLILVARIILTWFGGHGRSRLVEILLRITDPYLNWWRRRFNLRAGFLDLTPLAAMMALQVLQTIFARIAAEGSISLGIIIAVLLSAVWSVVAFLLGFCVIIIAIRFIGYLMGRDMYGRFWQIVDSIARPVIFRITRIIFRNRAVNFVTGIAVSLTVLIALWIIGGTAVRFFMGMLVTVPG